MPGLSRFQSFQDETLSQAPMIRRLHMIAEFEDVSGI